MRPSLPNGSKMTSDSSCEAGGSPVRLEKCMAKSIFGIGFRKCEEETLMILAPLLAWLTDALEKAPLACFIVSGVAVRNPGQTVYFLHPYKIKLRALSGLYYEESSEIVPKN